MKNFFILLFILSSSFVFAQISELIALDLRVNQEVSKAKKNYPDKQQLNFELSNIYRNKMQAYRSILSTIGTAELARENGQNADSGEHIVVTEHVTAEYKNGGIQGFRKAFAENFDSDVIYGNGRFRTSITFIVEKDGSVSNVKAEGDNPDFNTVAAITVYRISGKWMPGTADGEPVRTRFRFPATINF